MRVVLDTNVVISALVFGSRLSWLRHACAAGTIRPIICRETVQELLRVLAYPKFGLDATERELLLGDYLPFAETAALPEPEATDSRLPVVTATMPCSCISPLPAEPTCW